MATAASRTGAKRKGRSAPQVRARFYVPFFLAVALLIGTVAYGKLRPSKSAPPSGPGKTGALYWSNGTFANRAELKAWLIAHGKSYKVWAKQHPAALKLIPEK